MKRKFSPVGIEIVVYQEFKIEIIRENPSFLTLFRFPSITRQANVRLNRLRGVLPGDRLWQSWGRPVGNRMLYDVPSCSNFENVQMAEGTIRKLTDKGFGFISTGGENDLFFHSSSVSGARFEELREGQKVSFDEGRGPKGPCAENVNPL